MRKHTILFLLLRIRISGRDSGEGTREAGVIDIKIQPMKKTLFFSTLFSLAAALLEGQTPRLVIPLGHTFGIASAGFSPDGQLILTAGRDGTAKLWDLKGRLIQTFAAKAGVMAVAFSPDGKTLLTGSMDHTARLWDISGQERQSFIGHNHWVEAVAFSPDGKTIMTGGTDGTANLWDLNGKTLRTINIQSGGGTSVRAVTFSPNGRTLLIGSGDLEGRSGAATLWDLSGNKIKTFTERGEINAVAFSPDGQTLLTGSKHGVKLWDLAGNEKQRFADPVESLLTAAFSPDGKTILTGHRDGTAKLWDTETGEPLQVVNAHTDWITTAAFSPAGPGDPKGGKYILTGSEDGATKLWSRAGQEIQFFAGHTHKIADAAFSPDGLSVLTHSEGAPLPLSWALTERDVRPFAGQVSPGRLVSFLANSPDRKTKLVSDFFSYKVTLRDTADNDIQTFVGHNGHVAAVGFSPDGKTVLTGSSDGTAKLWNLSGRELATLVVLDSTDWVVTTPNGLFDASPGAMRLMYFVVGLEVIELDQLKERYYEPGLLSKVLGFSDEPLREVEGFDSVALYPAVRLQLDTLQNKLHIRLSPRNGGVGKVSVFVNGKEVIEEANPPKGFEKMRDTTMTIDLLQYARYFLADSLNDVSVRAYNAAAWLKSAPYSITYRPVFAGAKGNNQDRGAAPARLDGAPNVFILSVGTANYAGTKLDLKFAGKDALDMANAFQQIGRQLLHDTPGKVISHILTTDSSAYPAPTKANIRQAFEAIKKDARAADLLLVYFSGHGIARGDEFYYLTQDMSSFEVEIEGKSRTVSNTELIRWINDIPALKQVLILDACNSGKVVESLAVLSRGLNSSQIRALEQLKDRTGMFVLTGSAADKVSYEAGQFGQGLLTYSLLEGIKGEVPDKFGHVDVMKLFRYATDRVPELAKGIGGIQTPVPVGPLGRSFAIGISDSSVHIPIASEKPVFIRNVFLDEERFDDGLGLTNALKDYLIDRTALGDANFIYVDVSGYEAAYSMKGLYRISDDEVEVRGRLFKGRTPAGEAFNVKGKKEDVPGLVEAIVDEVLGMME